MNFRALGFILLVSVFFLACDKNTVSKIPHIGLIAFQPNDSMTVTVDTAIIEFSIVDGDGDIGYANPSPGDTSEIYFKDSRFDSLGYVANPFPAIDVTIEDPKKGLQGTCIFYPIPQPVPRGDSLHTATGDTLFYEFYIVDRAKHQSNHIVTHSFIVRP